MFDANASHIKEGEQFFAEVHATDRQLRDRGIKEGDLLLCEHVLKSNERPRDNLISKIWVSKDSEPFEWRHDLSDEWSWMVYSGRPNGMGFIRDFWKQKALDFLGGKWRLDMERRQ